MNISTISPIRHGNQIEKKCNNIQQKQSGIQNTNDILRVNDNFLMNNNNNNNINLIITCSGLQLHHMIITL